MNIIQAAISSFRLLQKLRVFRDRGNRISAIGVLEEGKVKHIFPFGIAVTHNSTLSRNMRMDSASATDWLPVRHCWEGNR